MSTCVRAGPAWFRLHAMACMLQVRFTERKLKLLDKITKKHMLEEIWYDRVEIGAEEQREAERETLAKKEEVRYVKGLNAQLLQSLGGQAADIGAAVGQFEE
eukprot:3731721-Pleurochrysis_carterae.AAC.1